MSLTNEFMIQLIKHDKTYNLKKKNSSKTKEKSILEYCILV